MRLEISLGAVPFRIGLPRSLVGLLAGVLLLAFSLPAASQVILNGPLETQGFSLSALGGVLVTNSDGSVTLASPPCSANPFNMCASETWSWGYVPGDGLIQATATSTGGETAQGAGAGASLWVDLQYQVMVTGPGPAGSIGIPVDLQVTNGILQTAGTASLSGSVSLISPTGAIVSQLSGVAANGTATDFAGLRLSSMLVNEPYRIDMTFTGNAGGVNPANPPLNFAPGTYTVKIDPMVAIDSSFTGTGYSVIFSPAAPEPQSLALMALGLGVVAAAAGRKRLQARSLSLA